MTEKTISISPHVPILPQQKAGKKNIIHRLKQNCIKHSLLCYHMNFIHSWTVTGKKTGKLVFRLSPMTLQIVLGVPTALLEIVWQFAPRVCSADSAVSTLGSCTGPAQHRALVRGRGAAVISQVNKSR